MASTNWPEIEIPGRGKVEVRFGLSAFYVLQEQFGVDANEVSQRLGTFFPIKAKDGTVTPGHINVEFLFKMLSACTWKTLHIRAAELAEIFDDQVYRLKDIAEAVFYAYAKTQWSAPPLTTAALNGTERAATN